MSHTWSKPIVCSQCGAKWQFNKKSWHRYNLPFIVLTPLILFTTFFGEAALGKTASIFLLIVLLVLFVASVILWAVNLGNIKVEPEQ
jgi:RsiW-degrading membrane proteinase PrsW (M82 family)